MAAFLCMKLNSLWKLQDLLGYAFRPALTKRAQHKKRTKLACTLTLYACMRGLVLVQACLDAAQT